MNCGIQVLIAEQDMSKYPMDEEFKLDSSIPTENAVQAFLGNFTDSVKFGVKEPWTPRRLGKKIALGGFHPSPVGTPEMVADEMERVSDPDLLHLCLANSYAVGG